MKILSLNNFYDKIDKSVKLVESYTEIENLAWLIRACRLKPYDLFHNSSKYDLQLYRHWFDEFGNSFKLVKGKKIKIILNDLTISNKHTTDFYYGLSINKVIKMSEVAHFLCAKDEFGEHIIFVTFLGLDGFLRSYCFYSNWFRVSPLILGFNRLHTFTKFLDIKYFLKITKKEKLEPPCVTGTEWITCLPMPERFMAEVKKECDIDLSFLN